MPDRLVAEPRKQVETFAAPLAPEPLSMLAGGARDASLEQLELALAERTDIEWLHDLPPCILLDAVRGVTASGRGVAAPITHA